MLTNKSGGSVAQGDVVVVDSANATAFTTTTTSSYAGGSIGVVMEPNGVASNAIGSVAFGGYVPLVNLSGSASLGDLFHAHSVAKQALRHAAPIVGGDFGQVLGTGTTPAAFLWGQPAAAAGGGSSTLAGDTDANISSPANNDLLQFKTSDSKWHNEPLLGTLSNSLSGNVTMTNANQFYDGPSVSIPGAGTWFLTGSILVNNSTTGHITTKLWDGTTVVDSAFGVQFAGGNAVQLPNSGIYVATGEATVKISAAHDNAGGTIFAAAPLNGAGNNVSSLFGVRVA